MSRGLIGAVSDSEGGLLAPFQHPFFKDQRVTEQGLNLHHIFDIAELPPELAEQIRSHFPALNDYRQLILFGHAGRRLWESCHAQGWADQDPIDQFSLALVCKLLKEQFPEAAYEVLYPSQRPLSLQQLVELAGWHHRSPFRIGVNDQLGSWFAYRVVVAGNTGLEPSLPVEASSPCGGCAEKPCVSACPADALSDTEYSLQRCVDYRREPGSLCDYRCLARDACPVGEAFRYSPEQVAYHYGLSLETIKERFSE